ncbi:mucin 2, oligomeric mucus gel-forming [Seminavis robusta]|uniref:Mucin 2, oligomeric mucus gel-forming n=1 Tax=Seminavis robusta TaxID=568900 RepID=A0A9N8EEQ6_9STRA|nr:mucin 2, oligomeric mucus gel-forming [Seminavis robusta]|eukprot:Sro829_g208160.1 mucin 2, oligomeric mucus gel-forming (731) ;mRNA; r:38289-40786
MGMRMGMRGKRGTTNKRGNPRQSGNDNGVSNENAPALKLADQMAALLRDIDQDSPGRPERKPQREGPPRTAAIDDPPLRIDDEFEALEGGGEELESVTGTEEELANRQPPTSDSDNQERPLNNKQPPNRNHQPPNRQSANDSLNQRPPPQPQRQPQTTTTSDNNQRPLRRQGTAIVLQAPNARFRGDIGDFFEDSIGGIGDVGIWPNGVFGGGAPVHCDIPGTGESLNNRAQASGFLSRFFDSLRRQRRHLQALPVAFSGPGRFRGNLVQEALPDVQCYFGAFPETNVLRGQGEFPPSSPSTPTSMVPTMATAPVSPGPDITDVPSPPGAPSASGTVSPQLPTSVTMTSAPTNIPGTTAPTTIPGTTAPTTTPGTTAPTTTTGTTAPSPSAATMGPSPMTTAQFPTSATMTSTPGGVTVAPTPMTAADGQTTSPTSASTTVQPTQQQTVAPTSQTATAPSSQTATAPSTAATPPSSAQAQTMNPTIPGGISAPTAVPSSSPGAPSTGTMQTAAPSPASTNPPTATTLLPTSSTTAPTNAMIVTTANPTTSPSAAATTAPPTVASAPAPTVVMTTIAPTGVALAPTQTMGLTPPAGTEGQVVDSTLRYQFFDEAMLREPTQAEVDALMVQTNAFYLGTFMRAFDNLVDFQSDLITYRYDANALFPVEIDFDAYGFFTEGTTIPTTQEMLTVLQSAEYDVYIMMYAWEAEPREQNLFFETSNVEYAARIGLR